MDRLDVIHRIWRRHTTGDNAVWNRVSRLPHLMLRQGDQTMPPLVYETAAWLRFYTCLPIPPLPGESVADSAPDLATTAHAIPLAGALIGLIGELVCLF